VLDTTTTAVLFPGLGDDPFERIEESTRVLGARVLSPPGVALQRAA